jgi:AcrR family transcriptional regulator
MSHLERREREKDEIRQKILDATRKIASKEGWHAVTIRKIADEIEYTPPIVYEHFENKEDLIRELIYTGFSKLRKENSIARQTETDPRKLLKMMSLIHWDFAFENAELYQLMFSLERPRPNEEMLSDMKLIEGIFLELANNNKELSHMLILSWMCLITGAISIMMKFPNLPHQNDKDPREIFCSIIDHFIERL